MNSLEHPTKLHTSENSKTFKKSFVKGGNNCLIVAKIRYDDTCRNGHNSFAVTATIYENGKDFMGGCCHEEIAKHFPELVPFIKWHLVSTDGPLHYVENSLYWAGKTKWEKANLENFRSAAVWPDATEGDMKNASEIGLMARLPELMQEFRKDIEKLGFLY